MTSKKAPDEKSVTVLTPEDLEPILVRLDALEASVTQHTAQLGDHDTLLADHDERIGALETDALEPPIEPPDATAPDKTIWEADMIEYGVKHGDWLQNAAGATLDARLSHVYYDQARVMYQIAAYTGDDAPWVGYAKNAIHVYRDEYVLPNNGVTSGYWNFTTGLRDDYEKTGDAVSKSTAILLSKNAAYAADTTPPSYITHHKTSREVAYAILSYINAEALGEATRAIRATHVTQSYAYIPQWMDQAHWGTDQIAPFMMAITAQALITDWQATQDARCLPALRDLADWMWPLAWHAPTSALKYQLNPAHPEGASTVGAPDLSMFIASWFAWLWQQTGDVRYRDQFDALLYSHKDAYVSGSKQFNQAYWWSFEGMRWREGGERCPS